MFRRRIRLALAAVLLVGVLAGVGAAQNDQPVWADEVFERMERTAAEYNAGVGAEEVGFLQRWLLSDARVNLHVEGPNGSEAVFSFRTDERLRVTRLREGGYERPTLRVRTSKETIDRLAAAADVSAAINREVWSGDISIERLYEPVPGILIAVGVQEVIIGAGGVALAAAAVAKFGVQGVLSSLWGAIQEAVSALVSAARTLWQNLAGVATLLTILEKIGLLDRLQDAVQSVWETVHAAVVVVAGRLRRSSSGETREVGTEEKREE